MRDSSEHDRVLRDIAGAMPAGTRCWLVGGALRDALTGRPLKDVDLLVDKDAAAASRTVADALGASCFAMDEGRGVYRAVRKTDGLQLDFSPLSGGLEDDLRGRDFTINAMAAPLESPGEVIDPFGGLEDMRNRTIRCLSSRVLADDPLRMLRAFRFRATLGFRIEPQTLAHITTMCGGIASVSPERVRDELYSILESGRASETFRGMDGCGLLGHILPEVSGMAGVPQPPPHEHGLLEHSFRAMQHAEHILAGPEGFFGEYAGAVAAFMDGNADGASLTMRGLTVLCALMHDAGKPSTMNNEGGRIRFIGHDSSGADMAAGAAARLRTSSFVSDTLRQVTFLHMRPLLLSAREKVTKRAMYRLCRDSHGSFMALMVVALADALATRERPDALSTDVEGTVMDFMRYYMEDFTRAKASPLLTGRDLMDVLGLEPGPAFRRILDDVEEARAEGVVADRESALVYVRENLAGYAGGGRVE